MATIGGFDSATNFSISSGFAAGLNTLDFVVNNAGSSPNPTGLRVEISGTANAAGGPSWYNTSWGYRKPITIDHTKVSGSGNLASFPMLFSVTDSDLMLLAAMTAAP